MEIRPTVLIADHDQAGFPTPAELPLQIECCFEYVANEEELIIAMTDRSIEILLLDLDFPVQSEGFTLLDKLRNSHPKTMILPLIPAGKQQFIKKILELDILYFINKPLDPLETTLALKRALSLLQTADPTGSSLTGQQAPVVPFHGMIGTSSLMQQLFDLVARVAEDDESTVLIRGESGTGKEMIAKAIHAQSSRNKKNFVPVNCAAIPDDLLESELFGYTKGAFTGATSNKPGRIQYADQGTLFLDEIGDMKSALQAKLLRVLQEKEFEPVGAYKSIPVNTRILAATHCDLERLVTEGGFREDLYYRLSVVPLTIPPLRERIEDIPHLIDTFLCKYADDRGRERFRFADEAMNSLLNYEWRGNVRELENLIQHMSILYSGKEIQLTDLPEKIAKVEVPKNFQISFGVSAEERSEVQKATVAVQHAQQEAQPTSEERSAGAAEWANLEEWESGTVDFNSLVNDLEIRLIVQALRLTGGNKKEAARLLNLKRTTLLEKIKKKDIDGLWEQ